MTGRVVIDDHLLRDVLARQRGPDLDGLAPEGIATTGLWLYRLCRSFADPVVAGKLSAPVQNMDEKRQARFRAKLLTLPDDVKVLGLRELAWAMAELQVRHRAEGRNLSATMTEALAAAHELSAAIAVSQCDVGPNLQAAAKADGLTFHIV